MRIFCHKRKLKTNIWWLVTLLWKKSYDTNIFDIFWKFFHFFKKMFVFLNKICFSSLTYIFSEKNQPKLVKRIHITNNKCVMVNILNFSLCQRVNSLCHGGPRWRHLDPEILILCFLYIFNVYRVKWLNILSNKPIEWALEILNSTISTEIIAK